MFSKFILISWLENSILDITSQCLLFCFPTFVLEQLASKSKARWHHKSTVIHWLVFLQWSMRMVPQCSWCPGFSWIVPEVVDWEQSFDEAATCICQSCIFIHHIFVTYRFHSYCRDSRGDIHRCSHSTNRRNFRHSHKARKDIRPFLFI